MKILISSCILNLPTRYDGRAARYNGGYNGNKQLIQILKEKKIEFIPLCSEQLGGLCTPREPQEIESGKTATDVIDGNAKVLTESGRDITESFLKGANIILNFCKEFNLETAILEERSPSCGVTKIYSGKFDGKLRKGRGVLTELLTQNGIKVFTIEEFLKENDL